MESKIARIQRLKKEKDAVILAHYYVRDEIQDIADYVGDSYYLSEKATQIEEKNIVLCGVIFMGESVKILNPDKTVRMPDMSADCPMAHMVTAERIKEVRGQYEDLAVVCYVNSTAAIKTCADVCVTSSNALKIVRALPNRNIFFIPDEQLGRYIAGQLPEKNFIFNDGYCHVHANISKEDMEKAKQARPKARILAHPECRQEVLDYADYVGSTSGIIDFATNSDDREFIICTEMGVMYELQKRNPDKKFYAAGNLQICPNMKKITLDKVIQVMETGIPEVQLDKDIINDAHAPLLRMLELTDADNRKKETV